jgi:Lysophospholipase
MVVGVMEMKKIIQNVDSPDLKDTNTTSISEWKGFERHDFYVNGREAILIKPKAETPDKRWIWRVEFFDAFSQADMAMLDKGWYLVYYRISNMYGCPAAVELMYGFHEYLLNNYSLFPLTVLFGFSRGGLYAFNYAAAHPEMVSALYLDAPVLDIRSWPGGMGKGEGAKREWIEALEAYGLDEDSVIDFKGNPLDKIDIIVEAGIPVIIVAGDSDTVVPMEENCAILAASMEKLGGNVKMIVKKGIGHHPHSLDDPSEIVSFIMRNAVVPVI